MRSVFINIDKSIAYIGEDIASIENTTKLKIEVPDNVINDYGNYFYIDGVFKYAQDHFKDLEKSGFFRIAEIKARLNEIDLESIRPLRAIAAGSAVQADTDKINSLNAERGTLADELAVLNG